MKTIGKLLQRDFKRLIKAPAALIVVIDLINFGPPSIPGLMLQAFWNPYEHTGNMRVCIVNEDAGAQSDLTGSLNMGDEIVDEPFSEYSIRMGFY